jgi:formylglycine-generating enzyme required for sulfatase activity
MTDDTYAPLASDLPAYPGVDNLDFAPYCNTLSRIIAHDGTKTPLTIGVFGGWGAGKTTLLRQVEARLKDDHVTVWFTAWKYDKEDALWRALLLRVVAAVRERLEARHARDEIGDEFKADLDALEETLYHAIQRVEKGGVEIDWVGAGAGVLQTVVQGAMASIPGLNLLAKVVDELGKDAATAGPERVLDALKRAEKAIYVAQVQSLEQFERELRAVIEKYVQPKRLVVFVDDLDRCLPEKAVDVLEAIKLFLDVEGCVFVLGMARDIVARGIQIKYGELGQAIDGDLYLEKIIQVPFDLPVLEPEDVSRYVAALGPGLADTPCAEVFTVGLGEPNPRRIKRMVNSYLFLSLLAEERAARLGPLQPVRLAKIVAIQHGAPALYSLLRQVPRYLAALERHYRELEARRETAEEISGEAADGLPPALRDFGSDEGLRRLLLLCADDTGSCFVDLTDGTIESYFRLVRTVTAPDSARPAQAALEPELATVGEGEFLRGTRDGEIDEQPQRSVHLSAYQIGRYPVTNLEYQAFVQATAHAAPRYWEGDVAPEGLGDHPVVNISYNDATAYCAWLSQVKGVTYRLPTEAEWEKAARGTDGLIYPWGNEFDPEWCNTAESGSGGTTPVGHYSPGGDSPCGCADMAGNVWEWCLDWYGRDYYDVAPRENPPGLAEGNRRVVRGGSWSDVARLARCASRDWLDPDRRSSGLGFRVVVALPISPGS